MRIRSVRAGRMAVASRQRIIRETTPMPISRAIDVHLLPQLVQPNALAGQSVVVIDILRATTPIIHALASGAREVVPCLEVEEARSIAHQIGVTALLGGERGG